MDKTLLKGLRLLEILAASPHARGVTELAGELGLTKSNIHRVMKTFEAAGYVVQEPLTSRYKLTLKLWELGSMVVNRLDLKREARDVMERLSDETRETVHLSVLDGGEVVYLDKIDSPEPVRAYSTIGGRAPSYAVATGKVLLAFADTAVIAKVGSSLKPFTPHTLRNRTQLLDYLGRVRKNGYAINSGEWRESVCGIAAPIYESSGTVVAAIGISGPQERMKPRRLKSLAPLILEAADSISIRLGHNVQTRSVATVEV